MNNCTSCGTKLEPGDRFCTNCGTAVSEITPANTQNGITKNSQTNRSTAGLSIDIIGSTIIGLVTFGIWWAFKIKKWSELHLKYYEDKFTNSDDVQSSVILSRVKRSTNRTIQLATITAVMISAGLLILILALFWEEVLDIGGFPIPEGPFWFYCWVSLSMLAVTWGSVLFGIFKVLELQSSNWLPLGGSSGIIVTTIVWCVLALGLLPLVIFPPITSGSVNKYIATLID